MGINGGLKKKADMELELLKKGVFWFSIHHFGRFLKSVILSHGLFVVMFSALIAYICSNAKPMEIKNNESPVAISEVPKYIPANDNCRENNLNLIEIYNFQTDNEKAPKNDKSAIKSKRNEYKNKRNECSVRK